MDFEIRGMEYRGDVAQELREMRRREMRRRIIDNCPRSARQMGLRPVPPPRHYNRAGAVADELRDRGLRVSRKEWEGVRRAHHPYKTSSVPVWRDGERRVVIAPAILSAHAAVDLLEGG